MLRIASSRRALAFLRRELDGEVFAAPQQIKCNLAVDRVASERAHQVVGAGNGCAIQAEQDIATFMPAWAAGESGSIVATITALSCSMPEK